MFDTKNNIDKSHRNCIYIYISKIIFFCGIGLWGLGLKYSKFYIGELGLINSFNILYIISYSMIILSIILYIFNAKKKNRNAFWLVFMSLVFVLLTISTPLIFEGTPRNTHSFGLYKQSDYIEKYGNLKPNNDLWYHSWPGLFIVENGIQKITGAQANTILSFTPIITGLLLYVFVLFSLKIYLKKFNNNYFKEIWVGLLIFVIFNFLDLNYFTPSNLGYVYFVVLIGCFGMCLDRNRTNSESIILLIIYSALVITHFISAVAIILVSIFLNYIINHCKEFNCKNHKIWVHLIVMFSVFVLAWLISGAVQQIDMRLPQFAKELYNFKVADRIVPVVSQNSPLIIIQRIRLLTILILICFAFVGIIMGWKKQNKKIVILSIVMIISMLPLLLMFEYSGEMRQRVYLYSLFPLTILSVMMLQSKFFKLFIIIFLIVSPSLHFINHYGNEILYYVNNAEICAAELFFEKTKEGTIACGGNNLSSYRYGNYKYESISPIWNLTSSSKIIYIWLNKSFEDSIKVNGLLQSQLIYSPDFFNKTITSVNNNTYATLFYDSNYVKYYRYSGCYYEQ